MDPGPHHSDPPDGEYQEDRSDPVGTRRVPLRVILAKHLFLGVTSFGGLGATLALAEREWVERRRDLSREELSEALACARLLPGSAAVQFVSFLGYRLRGWPGSVAATAAYVLPSVLAMLALAAAYGVVPPPSISRGASGGLLAAAAGLLLAAAVRLGLRAVATGAAEGRIDHTGSRSTPGPRPTGLRIEARSYDRPLAVLAIMAGSFVGAGRGSTAAWTVAAAGLLGVAFLRARGRGRGRRGGG